MIQYEYPGHKLDMSRADGIARCQCNAWQWHIGSGLQEAYAGHIAQEKEREEELLRLSRLEPARASRFGKVVQLVVTFAVFTAVMFTVLHFIG